MKYKFLVSFVVYPNLFFRHVYFSTRNSKILTRALHKSGLLTYTLLPSPSDYVIYGCYLKLQIPFEPIGQMIILPNSVGKTEVPRPQQRTSPHKFPSKLEKRPGKRAILTKHTHCLVSDSRHLLSANLLHLKNIENI